MDFVQWHRTIQEFHQTVIFVGWLISWLVIHVP